MTVATPVLADGPTTQSSTSPVRWAWSLVRNHRGLLAVTVVLRVMQELLPMLVPMVVGVLVDALTRPTPTAGTPVDVRYDPIIVAAAALAGIGILRATAVGAYTEASGRLGLAVVADIRAAVFPRLSANQSLSQGDLLARALRDPDRLRAFVDRVFVRSATTVVRGVFPTVMLFVLSPWLALWAISPIPLQQLGTYFLQRRLHRATRTAADSHADLTDLVQRHLNPTGESKPSVDDLNRAAEQVERNDLTTHRIVAWIRALVWLCTSLGLALLWYHGSRAVQANMMSAGMLVSFAGYAAFVYRPFRQFTQVVKTYQSGRASLERIAEVVQADDLAAPAERRP